jgi:hypothetical protein
VRSAGLHEYLITELINQKDSQSNIKRGVLYLQWYLFSPHDFHTIARQVLSLHLLGDNGTVIDRQTAPNRARSFHPCAVAFLKENPGPQQLRRTDASVPGKMTLPHLPPGTLGDWGNAEHSLRHDLEVWGKDN